MRLIESLKKKKFILLNVFLTLYIGINLIGGERGLISYFDKKKLFEQLNIKNKMLTNELHDLETKISLTSRIADMEHKNSLLSTNLDLDYVETLIRERFLFGKKGETIYIIKQNDK